LSGEQGSCFFGGNSVAKRPGGLPHSGADACAKNAAAASASHRADSSRHLPGQSGRAVA
jgi:hypothetical protein